MANTFLENKISSFIEDRFPEFVRTDHPVFVEFLRLYYQFMEAAKVTLTNVKSSDEILLENLLTDNFLLLEDGSKVTVDGLEIPDTDSGYGVFLKDETVVGQTSTAVATILAQDNANSTLYIEQNRHLQVGEIIVGSISKASATISKYQGNPVQNIQQLLEYANIDKTITDFFDQFREAYLTAIPNTLASGVSKRKLVKNIRDLYRAKGTKKGHELFFRLLFAETPEIFYPTDNLLKISAGEWSSDTIIRVIASEGDPSNLVGQTITQAVNVVLGAIEATASIEAVVQMQEGEKTVYQLILNLDSIDGTFITGATVSGIDSSNADISISATVQTILTGASVSSGGSLYSTTDAITVTSVTGQQAQIDIVDVGSGEVDEIIIDHPGIGYSVGEDLYFDNANTEGSGASAKITCIGGAVAPELGDTTTHTVTGTIASGTPTITNITTTTLWVGQSISGAGIPTSSKILSIVTVGSSSNGTITIDKNTTETGSRTLTLASTYDMLAIDHIVYEEATEQTDAYTGNQIELESGTWGNAAENYPLTSGGGLNLPAEAQEVVNITMQSGGSGYEKIPSVVSTSARIYWNTFAITTSGSFQAGETITNQNSLTATIAVLRSGNMSISGASGVFASSDVITGSITGAVVTLTSATTHGTGAILKSWSQSGIGAVKGVEVTRFGTGFDTSPTLALPVKFLITHNINEASPTDITLSGAFAVGDTIKGQTSEALGTVTSWENTEQILTVKISSSAAFITGEVLMRGEVADYAILTKQSQASITATIGTIGTTAGAFENDKGKISDSLMKIQDSYYYQDFSYVVRVGAAIADWRGSVKKAVHPAGFAMFGEVSVTSQVSAQLKTPIEILGVPLTTETPTIGSLFEAVLTVKVARRLGTADDGTTLRTNAHYGHHTGQLAVINSITRLVTTATVTTNTPHGIVVGQEIEISGVTTAGYGGGEITVTAVPTDSSFTYTVASNLASPAVLTANAKVFYPTPFDSDTRDITMSAHYDIPITVEILSGFDILQRNRYGLGATKRTASRYMWAVGGYADTGPVRQTNLEYAYPNITRRQFPETGTDNVTAGTAGVYDSTMNYTNIQIGVHEQNMHMTLEQFGGVQIDEIARPERIIAEDGTGDMYYNENDRDYFISEDNSYTVIESLDGFSITGDSQTIPSESGKLWNVPPPSYIRGINISSGEYVSFDDNTIPPDFSDNIAPPSFDATSGT